MKILDDLLGVDEFCAYLRKVGFAARRSTSAEMERLPRRWFAPDARCITIDDANIDLISIRMQGVVGPRQHIKARAFTFAVGPVPVMSKTVLPLRFHFLVWRELPADVRCLEARLRVKKRGWWSPQITGLGWEGGRLASVLESDPHVGRALRDCFDPDEKLRVEADLTAGCVRIIHGCTRVFDFSLLSQEIVRFHQRLAPPELLRAVDRIAGHARQLDCDE